MDGVYLRRIIILNIEGYKWFNPKFFKFSFTQPFNRIIKLLKSGWSLIKVIRCPFTRVSHSLKFFLNLTTSTSNVGSSISSNRFPRDFVNSEKNFRNSSNNVCAPGIFDVSNASPNFWYVCITFFIYVHNTRIAICHSVLYTRLFMKSLRSIDF